MKGKWGVIKNIATGDTPYIVGRLLDIKKPMHSGNIEYHGEYSADRAAVEAEAERLNNEEVWT